MTGPKVLIVEDEAIIAMTMARMLENEGYNVVGIVDYGEEAIQSIERLQPHIVLMDISLKGTMNGIEVTKIINKKFQLPVIYITGNTDEATYKNAMETGHVAYLEKPVQKNFLLEFIKNTIGEPFKG